MGLNRLDSKFHLKRLPHWHFQFLADVFSQNIYSGAVHPAAKSAKVELGRRKRYSLKQNVWGVHRSISVCLSVCMFFCLSFGLSVCLSVDRFVCLSFYVCLCICMFVSASLSLCLFVSCLSVGLFFFLSVCLSFYLFVSLSVCLSISVILSVCLSLCLSIGLFVCLPPYRSVVFCSLFGLFNWLTIYPSVSLFILFLPSQFDVVGLVSCPNSGGGWLAPLKKYFIPYIVCILSFLF